MVFLETFRGMRSQKTVCNLKKVRISQEETGLVHYMICQTMGE